MKDKKPEFTPWTLHNPANPKCRDCCFYKPKTSDSGICQEKKSKADKHRWHNSHACKYFTIVI